jgi:hypothetical protein
VQSNFAPAEAKNRIIIRDKELWLYQKISMVLIQIQEHLSNVGSKDSREKIRQRPE